jgi:hypothetical protein
MNQKKVESREHRLNRVKVQVEARKKALEERGLDEKCIKKDSTMRQLLAEARQVRRAIEAIQREPLKVEPAEKPAKEAAQPKASKPPKEKKPKQEGKAPPG